MHGNNVIYFDSFGFEHIPKEIRKFIGHKNVKTNIYIMQAHDLIICRHLGIGYIDFMLKGKSLLEYEIFFSPNKKKNDKIILRCFL